MKENRVDMSASTVTDAYGGWSCDGSATDNTVALTGGTISGEAYGGHSNNGAVTGNTVAISGGTANWVRGGDSETGAVTKNTVTISGGTVECAQGGFTSINGAVKNNTVTLAGGTVKNGGVFGGDSGDGDVTDNTVTISGGTFQHSDLGVYGGRSTKGTVKNNQVNISAGTVNGGGYPTCGIFGGYSLESAATNNTVTISGGTIKEKVVGGASPITATDNNIILVKGAAAANLQSATLYGSIRDRHGDFSLPTTHSGNTLTVEGEKNITVANVKNFDIYNFVLPADVQNEAPFLIINDGGDTDLGKASVTVTGEPALSLNTGDTLYLLKKNQRRPHKHRRNEPRLHEQSGKRHGPYPGHAGVGRQNDRRRYDDVHVRPFPRCDERLQVPRLQVPGKEEDRHR